MVVAQILANEKVVGYGYNAATGEYGDLFAMGIIDPTKVAKTALQNAASVSRAGADHRRAADGAEGEGRQGDATHVAGAVV